MVNKFINQLWCQGGTNFSRGCVGTWWFPIAGWLDTGRGLWTLDQQCSYLIYSTFSWNMINNGWFQFEMSHFNQLEQGPMFWKSTVLNLRWRILNVDRVAGNGQVRSPVFGGDVHFPSTGLCLDVLVVLQMIVSGWWISIFRDKVWKWEIMQRSPSGARLGILFKIGWEFRNRNPATSRLHRLHPKFF